MITPHLQKSDILSQGFDDAKMKIRIEVQLASGKVFTSLETVRGFV